MKTRLQFHRLTLALALGGSLVESALLAGVLDLASPRNPDFLSAPSAGGDSYAPLISADGRYVVFASTAADLAATSNGAPFRASTPFVVITYWRDRAGGKTLLASQGLDGNEFADGNSFPVALSTNGLFALFESAASNLVSGDTNAARDIFVRDFSQGATVLVSVATNGVPGNGASYNAVMTPDARFVAFTSQASNLVPADTNNLPDVFVRDLQSGSTILLSTNLVLPSGFTNAGAGFAQITVDGSKIAFAVQGKKAGATTLEINVRDIPAARTLWASKDVRTALQLSASQGINCFSHVLSEDGSFLAFEALPFGLGGNTPGAVLRYDLQGQAINVIHKNACVPNRTVDDLQTVDITANGSLVAFIANTNSMNGGSCVLVWESGSGAFNLASANLTNGVSANAQCRAISLDPQGRWIVFMSTAMDLVTNALADSYHFYKRDLLNSITTLLDVNQEGRSWPLTSLSAPVVSADGQYLAVECTRSELTHDTFSHVFVIDSQNAQSDLISKRPSTFGVATAAGSVYPGPSELTGGTRLSIFASDAVDLVTGDTNGFRDVFARDLIAKTNILISATPTGHSGNGPSFDPVVSMNGRYVAFSSAASDLGAEDNNSALDVYVQDLQSGQNVLGTVAYNGMPANSNSSAVAISEEGRYLLFRSFAGNLVPGSNAGENLFVRDLQEQTNFLLTSSATGSIVGGVDMTPDGRLVVFSQKVGTAYACLVVWDTYLKTVIASNAVPAVSPQVAIAPDGSQIAWLSNSSGVFSTVLRKLATGGEIVIGDESNPQMRPRFCGNGAWLAFSAAIEGRKQVYLRDLAYTTNLLVSRNVGTLLPANGDSDSATVTSDGRFVAFRSFATDISLADTNNYPDVFLFDRITGATVLLSFAEAKPGNSWSGSPAFNADGSTVLFLSWASNLAPLDFNQKPDAFAYKISSSPASFFVQAVTSAGGPALIWPSTSGKTYKVQFKDDLAQSWQDAPGNITINGSQASYTEASPASKRFFRVVEE